ncbi:hypothetical protein UR09_01500 [Candidatus Nitromaritima sp. SCGC AAA799-A02]|nr:hypothetical protein UR09_01500 [Candidatus Nitromaritima sp. SCGC AAA799-A02]
MSPRPKNFEENEALDAAMQVFWEKGYEATSIQDLVDRMGINRFSIYESFGNKHELFLSACNQYKELMTEQRLQRLRTGESGMLAIRDFFSMAMKKPTRAGKAKGCLITNSIVELALHDKEAKAICGDFLVRLEDSFHEALKRAKKNKELRSKRSLRELASYLTCFAQGLGVTGKMGNDPAKTRRMIETALLQL